MNLDYGIHAPIHYKLCLIFMKSCDVFINIMQCLFPDPQTCNISPRMFIPALINDDSSSFQIATYKVLQM